MARLVTSGFEWGAIAPDSLSQIAGLPTYVTSPVRSGSRAADMGSGKGGLSISGVTWALATNYYIRTYVNVHTAPSSGECVLSVGINANGVYNILLNPDLTLSFRAGTTVLGTSAAVSLDTYYRVEMFFNIGSGSADDSGEGRLEGVTIASETNATRATTTGGTVIIGSATPGSGSVVYYDDLAVNDGSGANQNTWPGAGKVVLLVPISDSAGGTGWTLGTGTALGGNGFAALDNTPPVGVADLAAGSDPKQIRNASANANVSYDANLTTYSNAGINATDTITVLVPVVITGSPVATGAKQGTIGISTNPVIANVALGAGGTAGAFWAGIAATTYPTGWKASFGTATYNPSVTKTSSPVARITQVTSSTRIAMVCAMGMYVEYVEAPSDVLEASVSRRSTSRRGIRTVKV